MKPSTAAVLSLLRERGEAGLTQLQALDEVGTFRLGARVWELRDELGPDEEIVTEWATFRDKRVARYILRRREPEQVTLW
jgi:hypothetical protein